jgi:hypothetical protein
MTNKALKAVMNSQSTISSSRDRRPCFASLCSASELELKSKGYIYVEWKSEERQQQQ